MRGSWIVICSLHYINYKKILGVHLAEVHAVHVPELVHGGHDQLAAALVVELQLVLLLREHVVHVLNGLLVGRLGLGLRLQPQLLGHVLRVERGLRHQELEPLLLQHHLALLLLAALELDLQLLLLLPFH